MNATPGWLAVGAALLLAGCGPALTIEAPSGRTWAQQDRDVSECWNESAAMTGEDPLWGVRAAALGLVATGEVAGAFAAPSRVPSPVLDEAIRKAPGPVRTPSNFEARYSVCLRDRGYTVTPK